MLDVYYLSHSGMEDQPLFQLDTQEMALLAEAFTVLREKTGVSIDPYGSNRLYVDHQKIIAECLCGIKEPRIKAFVSFLHRAMEKDEVLLFEGD